MTTSSTPTGSFIRGAVWGILLVFLAGAVAPPSPSFELFAALHTVIPWWIYLGGMATMLFIQFLTEAS